jgi:hypothetical protein
MMIVLRTASKGILFTALSREFPETAMLVQKYKRSFDLKAIRKRMIQLRSG